MEFPTVATLPKEDTQATLFLEHFPTFDGRDVVIAILDTGVDPGAVGMQVTTTGESKVIQLIDCTGSGDVDMSREVAADITTNADGKEERWLEGLTGRRLKIPVDWPVPPSGKYRLGWKRSADLFPTDLAPSVLSDRQKRFQIENHKLITKAQQDIDAHTAKYQTLKQTDAEWEIRQDLINRLAVLKQEGAKVEDPGLLWDVVTFHDGTKWRGAIDVHETGDFEGGELLAGYSDELKYSRFGDDNRLNYSLNFYDDGNLLSIVTLSGSHGTHVAAIAAANHPTDPRQNGVAPGAKIISLKIGEGRLKYGQETSQSLTRAAAELVRLKADVANISYGEAGATFNFGRCVELLREEVVNKAGCIVVSAAGNAGPMLTSVGHPSVSSGLISVGAYLGKNMPNAMYALLSNVDARPFSFSSMGPTLDGAVGVDIYAPGGAITSVPEYCKGTVQLMNGTSMASPNAAGCVSLLVSGLKQNRIAYNPYRIGIALRNTSLDVKDPLKVGLVQVLKAWEHLNIPALRHNVDVFYEVTVKGVNAGRGVYLRNPTETSTIQRPTVGVKPLFTSPEAPATISKMLQYEAHVSLQCSVPWIQAPEFVMMASSGREFLINIDPTSLAPGLHFGEVCGYDTNLASVGPLFMIPVTVCKCETSADVALYKFPKLSFSSGVINRKYISVPLGASSAVITLRSKNRVGNANFWCTFHQIQAQVPYTALMNDFNASLGSTTSGSEDEEFVKSKSFAVVPGVTGELVTCQYCTSLGDLEVSIEVEFHGLQITSSRSVKAEIGARGGGDEVLLNAGNAGFSHCEIFSRLRKEEVGTISVSLDKLQKSLRPTEAVVSPLKSRDVLPDGRQLHQLVLTYQLKVVEDGNVLPFFPRTMATFYDNFFESVWIFVFDSQKQLKSVHDGKNRPVKLTEGTYTVKMQIVSRDVSVLDGLKQTPILANYDVKAVNLPTYKTLGGLTAGTNKFSAVTLSKGESTPFWVAGAEGTLLPKGSAPGDLLLGTFKLGEGATKINAVYIVPSELPKKEDPFAQASVPVVGVAETNEVLEKKKDELADAIRDLEISFLKKLSGDVEKRDVLMKKLESEHGNFLPFLAAKLEVYSGELEKSSKPVPQEISDKVRGAIGAILGAVDQTEVAVYFGLKVDPVAGGEAGKQKQKDMETKKSALCQALLWKARLAKLALASQPEKLDTAELDEGLVELAKWVSSSNAANDGDYLSLWVWRLYKKGMYGTALKFIYEYLGNSKNVASGDDGKSAIWKEITQIKREILQALDWKVWVQHEERLASVRAPPSYSLF